MRIALYQMKMSEDIGENLKKSLKAIGEAAEAGADLILFPELQLCPFFPKYEKQEVSSCLMAVDHPHVAALRASCRAHGLMAAPNIYLSENGNAYDATLLIDRNGEVTGLQKMVHIAQAEGFYEQDYYTPSEEGFRVFDTPFGRIGIVVCFDRHYPESIRTEALQGADLILIPTANTVDEPSELFAWEVRIQAFQSSVAIAMCNRTGTEDAVTFSGESLVIGPNGETILQAGADEALLLADIDLDAVREVRAGKNYTELRRPELYV